MNDTLPFLPCSPLLSSPLLSLSLSLCLCLSLSLSRSPPPSPSASPSPSPSPSPSASASASPSRPLYYLSILHCAQGNDSKGNLCGTVITSLYSQHSSVCK